MVNGQLTAADFTDFIKVMESQPDALKRKISNVLKEIIGDEEASDWVNGTEESRSQATFRMIREAYERGVTPEEISLRVAGMNLLVLCLYRTLVDARAAVAELEMMKN